jgi:hypothetical protein
VKDDRIERDRRPGGGGAGPSWTTRGSSDYLDETDFIGGGGSSGGGSSRFDSGSNFRQHQPVMSMSMQQPQGLFGNQQSEPIVKVLLQPTGVSN